MGSRAPSSARSPVEARPGTTTLPAEHAAFFRLAAEATRDMLLMGRPGALSVADDIRRATGRPIAGPAGPLTVTMTIGVTMLVTGDTADDVIARADQAMYRAKEAGRDAVQLLQLDQ